MLREKPKTVTDDAIAHLQRQDRVTHSFWAVLITGLIAWTIIDHSNARAVVTTYTTPWEGGTIAPGDRVVLNNGASITGNVITNGTLQFSQSGTTLTVSSTISGTGTLSLRNTGTLNLTGTAAAVNTVVLDLTTTATAGLLQIRSGTGDLYVGHRGYGTLIISGGRVVNSAGILGNDPGSFGTATVSSGTWLNSGNLRVGASGSGTLTMTGGSVIVGGTLSKGESGAINLNPFGTLQIGTGGTTGVMDVLPFTNNGSLIFNRSDDYTYSGIIDGAGSVTKLGNGTLILSGSNSYSGGTGILFGTILVPTAGALNHPSSNITIGSGTGIVNRGGTLTVNGGYVTCLNCSIAYGKFLGSGSGTVNVSSGALAIGDTLVVGDNNTGTLNISGGKVSCVSGYLGAYAGSQGIANVSGGTWEMSGDLDVGGRGPGLLLVNGGTVTNQASIISASYVFCSATVSSGAWFTKGNLTVGGGIGATSGTGVLTMAGGLVTVGGTLSTGARGTINLNAGGVLQIGTGGTTGVLGVSTIANNGTLVFNRSDSSSYSGVISGSGIVSKLGGGTLVLSSRNSYSGGTELNAGTLVAGNSDAFGLGSVVLNSGTLDFASYTIANQITNNGGTIINAANYGGTQSVAGVVSMTGTVGGTVNVAGSGKLKGSGVVFSGPVSLESGAQHSPGNSTGTQTFTAGLSYTTGSILNWELIANSGAGAGTNYDFVSVTGGGLSVASGALLNLIFSGSGSTVSWSDPFWNADRSWTIIDALSATSSTGDFAFGTIGNDSLSQSLTSVRPYAWFALDQSGSNVVLTYTAVPEPAAYCMALAGLACGGLTTWRRRRAAGQ